MKQMSFPRSCSYVAVANLLESHGIDTTDRDMALEIGLPYQFRLEDGVYLAGTMLQTHEWFDRFLLPRGLRLKEVTVFKDELISFLTQGREPCMLGVELEYGKHAVNFHHAEQNLLVFSNNRHPDSDEPDWFSFTPEELLERVDEKIVVGMLEKCPVSQPDTSNDRDQTQAAFASFRDDLMKVWAMPLLQRQILAKLNTLFAPLFLDAPIMMDLIGQNELAQSMIAMRTTFLAALRQKKTLKLSEIIPDDALSALLDDYDRLLKKASQSPAAAAAK